MIDRIGNNDRSEGWPERGRRSAIVFGARERRTSAARRVEGGWPCWPPVLARSDAESLRAAPAVTSFLPTVYNVLSTRVASLLAFRCIINEQLALRRGSHFSRLFYESKRGVCLPPCSPGGLGSLFSSPRRASSTPQTVRRVPSSSRSRPVSCLFRL